MSKDRSEWGRLNAGQVYGILAVDIDRALANAGLSEHEQSFMQIIRERSWGTSARRKKKGEPWPDAQPARVNLREIAEELGVPYQRIQEARNRLAKSGIIASEGDVVSINKNAHEWTDPRTGAPRLSPAKLVYAAAARTRMKDNPSPPVYTPERVDASAESKDADTPKRVAGTRSTVCIPHGTTCVDRTSSRVYTARYDVYTEPNASTESDGSTADPETTSGASRAYAGARNSDPTGLDEEESSFPENTQTASEPTAETFPPSGETNPGPGRFSPEAKRLQAWADALGGHWSDWAVAKCNSYPAWWIKILLQRKVEGASRPPPRVAPELDPPGLEGRRPVRVRRVRPGPRPRRRARRRHRRPPAVQARRPPPGREGRLRRPGLLTRKDSPVKPWSPPPLPWFKPFAARHVSRTGRGDWPAPAEDPEFYKLWQSDLVKAGATEDVADEASRRVAVLPDLYPAQQRAAVVAAVGAIFRERSATGPVAGSREAAERSSRDCPECGGCGQASRRFECAASPSGVLSLTLGCLCEFGRWLTAHRRGGTDEAARSIPSLADHPDLWSPDDHHPSWPADAPRGRPLVAVRNPRGGDPIRLGRALGPDERSRHAPPFTPMKPRDRPFPKPPAVPVLVGAPMATGPESTPDPGADPCPRSSTSASPPSPSAPPATSPAWPPGAPR